MQTTTALKIRRYHPTDYDAVWHLHELSLKRVGAYAGDGPWDNDLRMIEKVYSVYRNEFLVGTVDSTVVAMGAFRQLDAHSPLLCGQAIAPDALSEYAEITRMRIHPDMQGRGYGREMVNALVVNARECGYKTLRLETSILQQAAQYLYQTNGFQEIGQINRTGLPSVVFERQIG